MIQKITKIQIPLWGRIIMGVLCGFLFVCYMIRMFYVMPLDSDYSNLLLEADDLIRGNFFLKEWNQTGISFLTTDLLYYVAAVLVKGLSREAYWLASGLMVSCMFFSALLLLHAGAKERHGFIEWTIFLAICACPSNFGINVLRAHTGVYVYAFIALACFYKLYGETSKKVLYSIVFAFSIVMGCIGDAIIYIVLILPVMLFCFRDLAASQPQNRRADYYLVMLTVASVTAAVVLEKIYYFLGKANKNSFLELKLFEDLGAYPEKFSTYIHEVLGLNHADFTNQQMLSVETFFLFVHVLIVIFAYIVIASNIRDFVKGKKGDVISQLLSLGFVVISLILIITNVSVDILSARYIGACPVIFAVLIVRYIRNHKMFRRCFAFGRIPHSAAVFIVMAVLLVHSFVPPGNLACASSEQERVKDVLVENGLKCGYANFWDASLITVLSGNEVKVRAVTIAEKVDALVWGCKTTWYQQEADFVLVRDEEWANYGVTYENVIQRLGEPEKVIRHENYRILVYDSDLSKEITNIG